MTASTSQIFPRISEVVVSDTIAADGTRVIVLLPDLDTLLGVVGFPTADAIVLPGAPRPLDGWTLFGSLRRHVTAH